MLPASGTPSSPLHGWRQTFSRDKADLPIGLSEDDGRDRFEVLCEGEAII
jgi:hypothetical protein